MEKIKKILIVDCGSSKVTQLEEAVYEFADYNTKPFFEVTLEIIAAFDGIILSGAPTLITEDDMVPYLEHGKWIKLVDMPILGICFGHQLIGLLYNACAARMKDCRSLNEIEQFVECPLLNRLPQVFEASHGNTGFAKVYRIRPRVPVPFLLPCPHRHEVTEASFPTNALNSISGCPVGFQRRTFHGGRWNYKRLS